MRRSIRDAAKVAAAGLLASCLAYADDPALYKDVWLSYQQGQKLDTLTVQQGAGLAIRYRFLSVGRTWWINSGNTNVVCVWTARETAGSTDRYAATGTTVSADGHYVQVDLDGAQTGTPVTNWVYAVALQQDGVDHVVGTGRLDIVDSAFAGTGTLLTNSVYYTTVQVDALLSGYATTNQLAGYATTSSVASSLSAYLPLSSASSKSVTAAGLTFDAGNSFVLYSDLLLWFVGDGNTDYAAAGFDDWVVGCSNLYAAAGETIYLTAPYIGIEGDVDFLYGAVSNVASLSVTGRVAASTIGAYDGVTLQVVAPEVSLQATGEDAALGFSSDGIVMFTGNGTDSVLSLYQFLYAYFECEVRSPSGFVGPGDQLTGVAKPADLDDPSSVPYPVVYAGTSCFITNTLQNHLIVIPAGDAHTFGFSNGFYSASQSWNFCVEVRPGAYSMSWTTNVLGEADFDLTGGRTSTIVFNKPASNTAWFARQFISAD